MPTIDITMHFYPPRGDYCDAHMLVQVWDKISDGWKVVKMLRRPPPPPNCKWRSLKTCSKENSEQSVQNTPPPPHHKWRSQKTCSKENSAPPPIKRELWAEETKSTPWSLAVCGMYRSRIFNSATRNGVRIFFKLKKNYWKTKLSMAWHIRMKLRNPETHRTKRLSRFIRHQEFLTSFETHVFFENKIRDQGQLLGGTVEGSKIDQQGQQ